MKKSYFDQTRRTETFKKSRKKARKNPKKFNYDLDYENLNLKNKPTLYRVGVGEQGVLLVEPYKSEILPFWRFKTPQEARASSIKIYNLFKNYQLENDFIGMDMCRKFLQMGYTRSRRYANHASGKKYDAKGKVLPIDEDKEKAKSAEIFYRVWQRVERNDEYQRMKQEWKETYG